MKVKKLENGYVLRLEMGEELIDKLTKFAAKEKLGGAFFHGLGGATEASLGIYRLDTDKQYHFKHFSGPLEIISLNGNIALVDDFPAIHCHATISGPDLNVSGGHVERIIIGGTCEIIVDTSTGKLSRTHDELVGLKLLELDDYEI